MNHIAENIEKVCIIYHSSVEHLGLFKDIKNDNRYHLCETYLKHISNPFIKAIRRIHMNEKLNKVFNIKGKYKWWSYSDIEFKDIRTLLIVDGALNYLDYEFLIQCKKKNPEMKIKLFLINSWNAESPMLIRVKEKISRYNWDEILTFDPVDAEQNGFKYMGFNYYSKPEKGLKDSNKIVSDVYFIGGLKGNRSELIADTYKYLKKFNIICNFNVMSYGSMELSFEEGIKWIDNGWKPYTEVVDEIKQSKCIIEILQEGQNGTSLRYFEAVCFNKKLLTNNSAIVSYPFYNKEYMKIFKRPEDIDIDWLKQEIDINYGYNDEFSPKYIYDCV